MDDTEAKEDGAAMEGRQDGSVAAEGVERRGASNGGFRRDGSQWVSRRVSKGNTSLEDISCVLVDGFPVLLGEISYVLSFGCRSLIMRCRSLSRGSFPRKRTRVW